MTNAPYVYSHPPGVMPVMQSGMSLLTTPQGGYVVLDRLMIEIWKHAQNQSLNNILTDFPIHQYDKRADTNHLRFAMACLVEAGLLLRTYPLDHQPGGFSHDNGSDDQNPEPVVELVSTIIVSYNSLPWLPDCLQSLHRQTHSKIEIIVVDNGSTDGSADWIEKKEPGTRLIRLQQAVGLARAINIGIQQANGKFHLILNPDTILEQESIDEMIKVLKNDNGKVIAAAKLKFLWAPAFLNGLGNFVGAISWGMDCALGHLDLGQFEHWQEIPSACFAAAMVPSDIWKTVGLLDEALMMYYEDTEWCYRARLLGYEVKAAPRAVVYHAFSSRSSNQGVFSQNELLSPRKLELISFGRLLFVTKLANTEYWFRYMMKYFFEDLFRSIINILTGRFAYFRATIRAWKAYAYKFMEIRKQHQPLSQKHKISNSELFDLQKNHLSPLIWHGYPKLTWELVCSYYGPILISGELRTIKEVESIDVVPGSIDPTEFRRLSLIYQFEGKRAVISHLGRTIQQWLRQP